PAGAVFAAARLPQKQRPSRAGRLARVRVAAEPRLHAGPAVRLSACAACPAVAAGAVAKAATSACAPARGRDLCGRRCDGARRHIPGAPLPEGLTRLPDRETEDQGSQKLFGGPLGAAGGVLAEPPLGRAHVGYARERALQER